MTTNFGERLRKERLARGWTLNELRVQTGISASVAGSVELGKSSCTEPVAAALDRVFPELNGWFSANRLSSVPDCRIAASDVYSQVDENSPMAQGFRAAIARLHGVNVRTKSALEMFEALSGHITQRGDENCAACRRRAEIDG